ncbi:MAG: thymidine kinase, partial [Myxococcales bacterium]|nr:thymidine kinase [Myxococcales bacterium]
MLYYRAPLGSIEVISGCMFSGKSEELIRRLRRAQIARQRVQIFKPEIDKRYSDDEIVSHSEQKLKAIVVKDTAQLLSMLDHRSEVVGIDEVQFFDEKVVQACKRLADLGRRVVVAGLDMDYQGQPFSNTRDLMAIAESVTKNLA